MENDDDKLELDMLIGISIGWFWFLLAVVLGLVGIFLNFLGHRYFKTGRIHVPGICFKI